MPPHEVYKMTLWLIGILEKGPSGSLRDGSPPWGTGAKLRKGVWGKQSPQKLIYYIAVIRKKR